MGNPTQTSNESDAVQRKVQVWIHSKAHVLILKMIPSRGGHWQPVTGGVEPGEREINAARREAKEETGLQFSDAPVYLDYEFEFESRWGGRAREQAFSLKVMDGEPPDVHLDPTEHEDFRWVTPAEARKYLHFESNLKALDILVQRGWE